MDLAKLNRAVSAPSPQVQEPQVPASIAKLAAMMAGSMPIGNNSAQVFQAPTNLHPVRIAWDAIKKGIKDERNRQGMTQRDLAAKSDLSQGTITRAERHGWISINALLKIAVALDMKEIKLT